MIMIIIIFQSIGGGKGVLRVEDEAEDDVEEERIANINIPCIYVYKELSGLFIINYYLLIVSRGHLKEVSVVICFSLETRAPYLATTQSLSLAE